jgi:hypothetical protein
LKVVKSWRLLFFRRSTKCYHLPVIRPPLGSLCDWNGEHLLLRVEVKNKRRIVYLLI